MRKFKSKNQFLSGLFLCLALAVTAFIFYQSLKSREQSGATSGFLMQLLKPLLDPENRIAEAVFHHYLRKTAHFTEFAALGLCWSAYGWQQEIRTRKSRILLPFLLTLSTAVADEYIQFFSHRGSAVTDVVLDYAGAVTGIGIVLLLKLCVRHWRSTKKEMPI